MEKEYRQAKLKAAANLCTRALPSNCEVALALDKIAQETEGSKRIETLVQMREDALALMKAMEAYNPVLIGSVWRGTIRRGSDIDLEIFHDQPKEVVSNLKVAGFKIQKNENMATTEHGKTLNSLHLYGQSAQNHPVEVVVRAAEEKSRRRKCDTFGDEIKGLTIKQLERLLSENPSRRFIPE